ncbi:hypothetical protein EV121DRAFT_211521 [Schizophyllum commune]
MHASHVYAQNLLLAREGYPLYAPEPLSNLPDDYRARGAEIGDVGVITKEGAFKPLLNICAPPDAAINAFKGVPPDFEYIGSVAKDSLDAYYDRSGSFVHSANIRSYTFAGGGAALALPQGGSRTDAERLGDFEKQIERHGLSWYEHAISNCGWKIQNGELYLLTGVDKASRWGALAFHNTGGSHEVSFELTAVAQTAVALSYTYQWRHLAGQAARKGPDASAAIMVNGALAENQCVFLRGYKIMVRDEIWTRLTGISVKAKDFTEPTRVKNPDSVMQSKPFRRTFAPGSHASEDSMGDTAEGLSKAEADITFDPIEPQEQLYHPCDALNRLILRHTECKLAFSHDHLWTRSVNTRNTARKPCLLQVNVGSDSSTLKLCEEEAIAMSIWDAPELSGLERKIWPRGLRMGTEIKLKPSLTTNIASTSTMPRRDSSIRTVPPSLVRTSLVSKASEPQNAKTRLHSRVNSHGWPLPRFDFAGPFTMGGRTKQWLCIVRTTGAEWGRAYGPTKQAAGEAAADNAYNTLIQQGY